MSHFRGVKILLPHPVCFLDFLEIKFSVQNRTFFLTPECFMQLNVCRGMNSYHSFSFLFEYRHNWPLGIFLYLDKDLDQNHSLLLIFHIFQSYYTWEKKRCQITFTIWFRTIPDGFCPTKAFFICLILKMAFEPLLYCLGFKSQNSDLFTLILHLLYIFFISLEDWILTLRTKKGYLLAIF